MCAENPWTETTKKEACGHYVSKEDTEIEIQNENGGIVVLVDGQEKPFVMVQECLGIVRGYIKDAYLKLFKDADGHVFAVGYGGRMLPRVSGQK